MTIDLSALDLTTAVRKVPDWVVYATLTISIALLLVSIASVFPRPQTVTITASDWTCTRATTKGITAVCAAYERKP